MDNLENLYKKSFENFERKPKGDFWARLEHEIPPKPKRNSEKKQLFFAFCAGLLCMLSIVIGGYLLFPTIEKKLGAFPIFSQAEMIEKTEGSPIVKSNKEGSQRIKSNLKQTQKQATTNISSLNNNNGNSTPLNNPKRIAHSETIGEKWSNRSMDNKKGEIIEGSTNKNKSLGQPDLTKEVAIHQQNRAKKIAVTTFLTSKNMAPLMIAESPLPLLDRPNKKRAKRKKMPDKYPFVGAAYTPMSAGIFNITDHGTDTRFKELINNKSTKGWSIQTGIRFEDNWVFQVGVHHHQYHLSKKSQVAISTNLSDAIETEQEISQNYAFKNIAITEPLQGTIKVISPKATFQNGDIFLLNVGLEQVIKVTGISSQIGYHFKLNPRWSFTPKVGISTSWGSKGKVILAAAALVDKRQQLAQINLSNTNVTTSNLIEGLLTPEIEYRYTKRISIIGAPQFRLSFAPFFRNHERSVRHHFGQLKFGIRIHL